MTSTVQVSGAFFSAALKWANLYIGRVSAVDGSPTGYAGFSLFSGVLRAQGAVRQVVPGNVPEEAVIVADGRFHQPINAQSKPCLIIATINQANKTVQVVAFGDGVDFDTGVQTFTSGSIYVQHDTAEEPTT